MKYLGINLIKEAQDLENYKTLLTKIFKDLNKWKSIPYSYTASTKYIGFLLNVVKMFQIGCSDGCSYL